MGFLSVKKAPLFFLKDFFEICLQALRVDKATKSPGWWWKERERERGRATHHETKYVSKWVVMYIILQVYRVKICSFLLIESHCTYIRKWLSSHPTSNRECVFFLVLFFGNTPATHVGWIPTIELIVATWGMSPSYLETLWLRNCKWQSMFQGCLIHSWVN